MEYMTQDDKDRLEKELKDRTKKRRELSNRIGRAREMGDLKENAESHAAREDQGMNEARIHDLKEQLSNVVIADTEVVPDDMVFVGSTVKLKDTVTGNEEIYKLVGEVSGTFNPELIEVTPNSSLGMGLMKAKIGESVSVDLPRGSKTYKIVEIL
jgi:transcription elongation factor GreA